MTAKKRKREGPACTVPGCDNPVHLRGLCEKHWTGQGK